MDRRCGPSPSTNTRHAVRFVAPNTPPPRETAEATESEVSRMVRVLLVRPSRSSAVVGSTAAAARAAAAGGGVSSKFEAGASRCQQASQGTRSHSHDFLEDGCALCCNGGYGSCHAFSFSDCADCAAVGAQRCASNKHADDRAGHWVRVSGSGMRCSRVAASQRLRLCAAEIGTVHVCASVCKLCGCHLVVSSECVGAIEAASHCQL
jgi:hypothetical protein